jgi:hypothetical protein
VATIPLMVSQLPPPADRQRSAAMNRPVLHNMYLPGWIHRFANGAIGGIAGIGAGMVAMRYYSAPVSALWLGALTFAVAAAFDPKRFTLVEGCAGEVGYNELEPPPSNSVQLTRNSFGWVGRYPWYTACVPHSVGAGN